MSWRSTTAAGHAPQPNRRVAVIDLGSNSWRLVVFTYKPGRWWKRTDELYETVRIASGLEASGRLSDKAMARALETLLVFERFCVASGLAPEAVHALATSAIRDAQNSPEFLALAHQRTRLRIEILPAESEAHYGYLAAVNTSTLVDGAVLDLGGGSLQLTRVNNRSARAAASFPLGAVRVTEQFLPGSGPAKKKELERVRRHVRELLGDLVWLPEAGPRLVALGGAVRNLAAAAQPPIEGVDLGVQGFVLSAAALGELINRLAELPAAERGKLPGIKPGRADIILAAALVLQTVLDVGGFDGIEVTEASMREGVFFERNLLEGRKPLLDDVREAAVRNLAIQYESDMGHVEHVARLSLEMFDSLVTGGMFEAQSDERELLWAASMLHDVGMMISYDDHHKHSRYLVESAELPGFDPRERALIGQMCRYHRKGVPKLGGIAPLTHRRDRELLERCSVILRLAEHLERGHDQSVSDARLRANGRSVDLRLQAVGDLTLPRWSIERYGDDEIFHRVFGRRLVIG